MARVGRTVRRGGRDAGIWRWDGDATADGSTAGQATRLREWSGWFGARGRSERRLGRRSGAGDSRARSEQAIRRARAIRATVGEAIRGGRFDGGTGDSLARVERVIRGTGTSRRPMPVPPGKSFGGCRGAFYKKPPARPPRPPRPPRPSRPPRPPRPRRAQTIEGEYTDRGGEGCPGVREGRLKQEG